MYLTLLAWLPTSAMPPDDPISAAKHLYLFIYAGLARLNQSAGLPNG
jgi:hypothetical protein